VRLTPVAASLKTEVENSKQAIRLSRKHLNHRRTSAGAASRNKAAGIGRQTGVHRTSPRVAVLSGNDLLVDSIRAAWEASMICPYHDDAPSSRGYVLYSADDEPSYRDNLLVPQTTCRSTATASCILRRRAAVLRR
jgi:hypothetical protein